MAEQATQLEPEVPGDGSENTSKHGSTEVNLPANSVGKPAAAIDDHPDGPAIRRQVEYYFSDQNLPTDLHLLQCCGGRANNGVSIGRICGFSKMRVFKKKIVVQELRKSTFLEVSEDGKKVKRKLPLTGKCLLDEDYYDDADDDQIAYDPRTKRAIQYPVQNLPQEKKKLPPGVSKNMLKPTGFETTFVEGPLPPAEAAEELAMYDPDKSFVERIELAIQRFCQKRRMHEMYSKVFGKWMKFGGVDQAPRMFGCLSQAEMKEMTSEEISRATTTYHVSWDRGDEKKWVVDFPGIAEAFLSSYYPSNYGHDEGQVKNACQVLRSFYQYLMFHHVCDEYKDQLVAAKLVCDRAQQELPQVASAGNKFPGSFNVAASTIFGGMHADRYTGLSEWATDLSEAERKTMEAIGMRNEIARITFKTAVVAYGTEAQFAILSAAGPTLSTLTVEASEALGLEVIAIHPPTTEAHAIYAHQNAHYKNKAHLQPLGRLICKPWLNTAFKAYDLPPDDPRYPFGKPAVPDADRTLEFWVEDEVLQHCFVGMKMDAVVLTVTGGFLVLDEVKEVFCSFYRFVANELWVWNKEPKFRFTGRELEGIGEDGGEYGTGGEKMEGEDDVGKEKVMGAGEMDDDFEEWGAGVEASK